MFCSMTRTTVSGELAKLYLQSEVSASEDNGFVTSVIYIFSAACTEGGPACHKPYVMCKDSPHTAEVFNKEMTEPKWN